MQLPISPEAKVPFGPSIPLALQHAFAMFGSTVLVPLLLGLDPRVALMMGGIGTLIYLLCTQFKVPSYLGSSFAFIAPILALKASLGLGAALAGAVGSGVLYVILALIIQKTGSDWIHKIIPPAFVGAVIVVIGLTLAPAAISDATGGAHFSYSDFWTAMVTLGVAVAVMVWAKGRLGMIPVLIGMIGGYVFAALRGQVDWSIVAKSPWFGLPHFVTPVWNWQAMAILAPVAFVTVAEHLGHLFVAGSITERDFFKNPGLGRSLMGDGIPTILAGLVGAAPTTTYGENLGVLALTQVYSTQVIAQAAVFAILLSFVGKLGGLLQAMPMPVIGGISMLLFGVIAASGFRTLVDAKVDFGDRRNLVLSSVVLAVGVGNLALPIGRFPISSLAMATGIGLILNGAFLVYDKIQTGKNPRSADLANEAAL